MNKFIKKTGNYAFALGLIFSSTSLQGLAFNISSVNSQESALVSEFVANKSYRYDVPFYSQFRDIELIEWQKLGCGIASLAMVIEYYKPNTVSVMKLLNQAINSGAYQQNIGWKHKELSVLAERYGLVQKSYDLIKSDNETAFAQFLNFLQDGPVVVSIHNKFNPQATLGHIVVITGFENDVIFYNDPAGTEPERKISTEDFLKGWKKRFIVIREELAAPQVKELKSLSLMGVL